MKNKMKYIIVFVLLLSFCILSFFVCTRNSLILDEAFYSFISKYINKTNTIIFRVITFFGDFLGIIIIIILSFAYFKDKKINTSIMFNLGFIFIFNTFLKLLFRRERPSVNAITSEKFYSYPSAHAMVSTAFYGYLIYLINKKIENKYIRIICTIFLSLLIISIAISRIYLGVHYTSDVLGGVLISLVYLIFFISLINKKNIDLFRK